MTRRRFIRAYDPLGMYVAVPHYDREHIHVHIAASAIHYRTGESIWKSNSEFKEVKRSLETYQEREYPALSHSIVGYKQRYRKLGCQRDGEYRAKQRGKRLLKRNASGHQEKCYGGMSKP